LSCFSFIHFDGNNKKQKHGFVLPPNHSTIGGLVCKLSLSEKEKEKNLSRAPSKFCLPRLCHIVSLNFYANI